MISLTNLKPLIIFILGIIIGHYLPNLWMKLFFANPYITMSLAIPLAILIIFGFDAICVLGANLATIGFIGLGFFYFFNLFYL